MGGICTTSTFVLTRVLGYITRVWTWRIYRRIVFHNLCLTVFIIVSTMIQVFKAVISRIWCNFEVNSFLNNPYDLLSQNVHQHFEISILFDERHDPLMRKSRGSLPWITVCDTYVWLISFNSYFPMNLCVRFNED